MHDGARRCRAIFPLRCPYVAGGVYIRDFYDLYPLLSARTTLLSPLVVAVAIVCRREPSGKVAVDANANGLLGSSVDIVEESLHSVAR